MKEQTRNTEIPINEEEIGKLPEKEFRIVIVKVIKNLRYADDTTFLAEIEDELKSLLNVKEESEKAGLKLNI